MPNDRLMQKKSILEKEEREMTTEFNEIMNKIQESDTVIIHRHVRPSVVISLSSFSKMDFFCINLSFGK